MKNKIIGLFLVVMSCLTIYATYNDNQKTVLTNNTEEGELKLGDTTVITGCLTYKYTSSGTVKCIGGSSGSASISGTGSTAADAKTACASNAESKKSSLGCSTTTYSCSDGTGTCSKCKAGYILANGSCTSCKAGTYSSAGATSCTSCKAGTYSNSAGASSCLSCVANKYSKAGATSCTECPSGSVSNSDHSDCTECAAGTYQSGTSCLACPSGETSTKGSTSCTKTTTTCKTTISGTSSLKVGNAGSVSASQTGTCTNKTIVFSSSDTAIATVTSGGTVRALAVGTITVYAKYSGETSILATKTITVTEASCTRTSNVNVTLGSSNIKVGETTGVSYTKANGDCSTDTFYYKTGNSSIATVSSGVVKGVSVGSTSIMVYRSATGEDDAAVRVGSVTITIEAAEAETTSTCTIDSLTISGDSSLAVTQTKQYPLSFSGSCGTTYSNYTFSVSGGDAVNITGPQRGVLVIKGLSVGETTITVTATSKTDTTVKKTTTKKIKVTDDVVCPYGYTSDGAISSTSECYMTVSPGYKLNPNATEASLCEKGTYANTTRTVYYGSGSSCASCPEGTTTADLGSKLSTDCVEDSAVAITCAAGTYLVKDTASGGSCTDCPSGAYCLGGTYAFNKSYDQGISYCKDLVAYDTEDGSYKSYIGNGKTKQSSSSSCRIQLKCRRLVMASPPQLVKCTDKISTDSSYTDELITTAYAKWVNWGTTGEACTGCGTETETECTANITKVSGNNPANPGDTIILKVTDTSTNNLTNDDYTWSIVSGSATITSAGVVTINSDAEAGSVVKVKVISKNQYNGVYCEDTYKITLKSNDTPSEDPGEITSSNISLCPGDTQNIAVTFTKNPSNKKLTYSIDDSSIATVDSNGKVTGIKEGEATVTITPAFDTTKAITIKVAVGGSLTCSGDTPVVDIDVIPTNIKVCPGDTQTIGVTFNPTNTSDKKLYYTIDDSQVATVSEDGVVTGKMNGTTVVTVIPNANQTIEKYVTVVVDDTGCTVVPVPPTDKFTDIIVYIGSFMFLGIGAYILMHDEDKKELYD